MKTNLLLGFMMLCASTLYAQGFQPPAEGKAVVYFTRVSSFGFAISFEYFHEDQYIGIFKGKNYLRYECDPGTHLFWASSENKEFITAELEAGGSYIVIVDIIMGIGKARVGFDPITEDSEVFARAKELITSKPPVETPQAKIDQMNVKLRKFITEKLQTYETVWKHEKNFKHLSADMALSEGAMQ